MKLYKNFINDGTLTNFYGGKTDSGYKLQINQNKMTAVEQLIDQLTSVGVLEIPKGSNVITYIIEQAKEMEKEQKKILNEALEIIKKFVNEFDEEGEVSWNTRDEAENFLNNL